MQRTKTKYQTPMSMLKNLPFNYNNSTPTGILGNSPIKVTLTKQKSMDRKTVSDLEKYYPNFSPNGKAAVTGYIGEARLCDLMGWEQVDGDGFDALSFETIEVKIGNEVIKTTTKPIKIEIKTISGNTVTNVLTYNHVAKGGKYGYLAIYHYTEDRLSLISHKDMEKLINTTGKGLTINFNPKLRHNHKNPVFSELTKLFLANEVNIPNQ